MTPTDQKRLRSYNQKAGPKSDDKKEVEVGDKVFKIRCDAKSKMYRVEYATKSIPYNEVIAITYAWHETNRKHKPVEVANKIGKPIELGIEWDVDAVLQTLVDLSEKNWIWMDQFSLDKDKVTTTDLCNGIPTIYRNVRVVAFLPYKVCHNLYDRIKTFREPKAQNVSAALAGVMLHDLVCECTDGLYGWLSRLWTWQELMLASSLRFVWGLGKSQWNKREIFKEDNKPQGDRKNVLSQALGAIGDAGKRVNHVVKRSVTNISVFEQPITRLLNELTKRNTESVIIPEGDTATLSMGYYICMRLLCGAEVHLPSATRTAPENCLKVLQQIASTGRKGGRMYDCYYAALAFIGDAKFLPEKQALKYTGDPKDTEGRMRAEIKEELALREAYFGLYEFEHAYRCLPEKHRNLRKLYGIDLLREYKALLEEYMYTAKKYSKSPELNEDRDILDNPAALLRECKALLTEYTKCYAKGDSQGPTSNDKRNILDNGKALRQGYEALLEQYTKRCDNQNLMLTDGESAKLRKCFADLYHDNHNTLLVKHCGVPVPSTSAPKKEDSMDNFHPLAWTKKTHSQRAFVRLDSKQEEEKKKRVWNPLEWRQKMVSNEKKDSKNGFLNAFVLSGMNEEAFYESQRFGVRGEMCVGTAYDIQSFKPIKVGGTLDLCFASIYKIIANMHPSQLTRARNFNSIPTEMNLSLYPIAHAIIHASCYSNEEHPSHLAHVVSGLLSRKITAEAYVNAVAMLVGEGFDFILDENRDRKNQFELVKITFSDGTRCVGIVSKLLKNSMANTLVKSASTSNSEGLTVTREKHFAADKKFLDGTTASKATAATGKFSFVKKSVLSTSVSEAVSCTRRLVRESVDEVGATAIRAVAAPDTFVKESISEVTASTKSFVEESVKETAQYVAKKVTAATIAASLTRASIKVVKSHHRQLLCSGGDTDVSDWSVVGYIPGFDAETNKAVLGPISHSGVHIELNKLGDDSSGVKD